MAESFRVHYRSFRFVATTFDSTPVLECSASAESTLPISIQCPFFTLLSRHKWNTPIVCELRHSACIWSLCCLDRRKYRTMGTKRRLSAAGHATNS